jgi:hypothetical protein
MAAASPLARLALTGDGPLAAAPAGSSSRPYRVEEGLRRRIVMKLQMISLVMCAALGVLSSSCSKGATSTEQPTAGGHPTAAAAASIKPGSHEDWCDEHGVAESMCTRCNPSLIAAFKATGDWCAEHGLPESQCLKCHPDLKIVRPPKEK